MLDPVLSGSLISAGTGVLQNIFNAGAVRRVNESQKDLARYQVDLERQLINEQNAYNTPASQMARYQEAGLNPNLIYGNGSSSAGNQNTIARYNAPGLESPRFDFGSIGNVIQTALSLKRASNENRKSFYDSAYAEEMYKKLAMENEVFSFLTNTMQPADGEYHPGIDQSLYLRKYSAELNAIELGNVLKKSSETLNQLSASEKDYYIKHIQPLVMQGQSLNNNLLRKEVNTFMLRFGVDAGTKLVGALNPLTRFIKSF